MINKQYINIYIIQYNNMKIQVYSDLHLEFYKNYPLIKPLIGVEVLILAGDIGILNNTCFKSFFDYISVNWKKIFYVLGNHEYYHSNKTYENLNMKYKQFFQENYSNITILDKDIEIYNDVCFIGCTLWSFYPIDAPDNYTNCLKMIKMKDNDKYPDNRSVSITKEYYNKIHLEEKQWLLDTLKIHKEEIYRNNNDYSKMVVITHYPCKVSGTSHSKYNDEKFKHLFANDLDFTNSNNLHSSNICFIAGHTHYSYDFVDLKKNIRHISNQMGYKNEVIRGDSLFNENGSYDI